MSPRSNGVMKLRRTASRTSPRDVVCLILQRDDTLAVFIDIVAGKQLVQRVRRTHNRSSMRVEQIKEPVFPGKQSSEKS